MKPIARLDSDDEATLRTSTAVRPPVTPGSARTPIAAPPNSPVPTGFGLAQEDTPRPPPMKLVMSMFDTEAVEDNEIEDDNSIAAAWNSPSPSPHRAGPSKPLNRLTEALRLTTVERAKVKAKALIEEAEALVARAHSGQLTDKDHFEIAEARRKAQPSSGAMYAPPFCSLLAAFAHS